MRLLQAESEMNLQGLLWRHLEDRQEAHPKRATSDEVLAEEFGWPS